MERYIMQSAIKKISIANGFGKGIIDKNIKSYKNDPAMIMRAKEAMELLKRVGLPTQIKSFT